MLANPERYDGRKIVVSGYVTLAFEEYGVHLDRAAFEAGLRKNALWVRPPRDLDPKKARKLNRHYGSVAGTFDASIHGHGDLYSGAMIEVQQITPTFTQADYGRTRLRDSRDFLLQCLMSGWFLTLVGWMALWVFWAKARQRR